MNGIYGTNLLHAAVVSGALLPPTSGYLLPEIWKWFICYFSFSIGKFKKNI